MTDETQTDEGPTGEDRTGEPPSDESHTDEGQADEAPPDEASSDEASSDEAPSDEADADEPQAEEDQTEDAHTDGTHMDKSLNTESILPAGADEVVLSAKPAGKKNYNKKGKLKKAFYESELVRLQEELVKLQYWVKQEGLKVLIIFEGRGSAGKGGVINRISERTSPRIVRVEAMPKPTEREQTQWYFQRYVPILPSGGEIVMFDRSWYNRSNVEWVMGFCTPEQHQEFLRTCPEFERMLVRSGIILLKYWFSVSYEEQARRFEARNRYPLKRWKLSDMDIEEHRLFVKYSMAKDITFQYTDIKQAPWYVVPSDDKKRARLNCMSHILSSIGYQDIVPEPVHIPEREEVPYIRPPMHEQAFVPQLY